jgi:cell fate regulator YaaT (PSP1 superfamily)
MFYVGQFTYDGDQVLTRGAKLVVRTPRGVELAEMLTTPCFESGCPHTISRKQMHAYIERSGGKQYPFAEEGKVLRIASPEDLMEQQHLDAQGPEHLATARAAVKKLDLPMKLIDVELLLGGDRIVFYFMSENRVDFRELVRGLASEFHTRIEMRQIGARDEARIVADYEKCGQHCCCRQFLKVLRPVSMRSAKIQKATLDPSKISGRCGRLMCCLRYEDQTYDELRKQLPNRNTRVTTADGPGRVVNTQIITQLVMVELESTRQRAAYPLEDLNRPEYDQANQQPGTGGPGDRAGGQTRRKSRQSASESTDQPSAESPEPQGQAKAQADDKANQQGQSGKKRKRRRRRKRRRKNSGGSN